MRKLFALFKITLTDLLEYRLDVLFYTFSSLARPVALLFIWLAAYSSGAKIPMSREALIQYYLLLLFVRLWTDSWGAPFIMSAIRNGNLSTYLLKPFPYIFYQLANNFTEKILKTTYMLPAVFGLFIFLGARFPLINAEIVVVFFVSLLMAIFLNFLINFLVGISAFWLDESTFVDHSVDLVLWVFSGYLFPLSLLPMSIQPLANILPFRYTLSLPLEIILGQTRGIGLVQGMCVQLTWLVCVTIAAFFIWKVGVKKYSAAGN